MARIDVTLEYGTVVAKTTKDRIEEHLIERNPKVYRGAGLTPFGDSDLGRCLGPFESSSLVTAILEGPFKHDKIAINAIVKQLHRVDDVPMQPRPKIT
jgi:hypothetical protein